MKRAEPALIYLPAGVGVCTGGQCLVVNWLFHVEQAAADWSPVKHLFP